MTNRTDHLHRGAVGAIHALGDLAGVALFTLANVALVLILAGAR